MSQKSGIVNRTGFLPARQAKSRKNPMQVAVREIGVVTETGGKLRVLTHDLDAPAQEIADLYKRRWQIELFFRFVKQTLKIKHFLGHSENAVRMQIAVALIAFLLLHMLRMMTKGSHGALELVRLVRTNLTHRKDVTRLRENQFPPPLDSRQLTLDLAITTTGQPWLITEHDTKVSAGCLWKRLRHLGLTLKKVIARRSTRPRRYRRSP